jgi:glycosyltransferase involved in cell wall biosynthesis
MNKNIVILTTHIPDKDPRVLWFYDSLSKTNDVSFISTDPFDNCEPNQKPYRLFFQKPEEAESKKFTIYKIPSPIRGFLKKLLFLTNPKYALDVKYKNRCVLFLDNMTSLLLPMLETYQTRKPIDVIHACDLDTLKAAVLFKKNNPSTKVFFDAHEFWPEQFPDLPDKYRHYLRNYEKELIPFIDTYCCVSDPMAEYIKDLYKINNVITIPNACPNSELNTTYKSISNIQEITDGRRSFLFQGGFGPERGLEELTYAWSKIDPKKAVLFLRGQTNDIYKKCQQIAKQTGTLEKSVYFLPSIPENILIQEAQFADIGVIPYKPTILNHVFACPNKLSQYMQAGLPIMASNCPYVEKQVKEANGGFVFDPSHQQSIIDTINHFIDMKDLTILKTNSKRYATMHYNWDLFFEKTTH